MYRCYAVRDTEVVHEAFKDTFKDGYKELSKMYYEAEQGDLLVVEDDASGIEIARILVIER